MAFTQHLSVSIHCFKYHNMIYFCSFRLFAGSFVYIIFGTIPQVSIGPTSLMAILTLQFTMDLPVEFVISLAFISGIVELAMGIFNLGKNMLRIFYYILQNPNKVSLIYDHLKGTRNNRFMLALIKGEC